MIDWVTDKIVMSIIALVLVTSAFAYYNAQEDTTGQDTLQAIAEKIASAINDVSQTESRVISNISFHSEIPGKQIQQTVDGNPYTIKIFQSFVIVEQGNRQYTADIVGKIHLGDWRDDDDLSDGEADSYQMESYDRAHRGWVVTSGDDIRVERALLVIDGVDTYMTFVYSEHGTVYTIK